MDRFFIFTWTQKKYSNFKRRNKVIVPNASEDIGTAASRATDIFCSAFGSLVKNEIIEIQEVNSTGAPIGEPIRPIGESTVPLEKRV